MERMNDGEYKEFLADRTIHLSNIWLTFGTKYKSSADDWASMARAAYTEQTFPCRRGKVRYMAEPRILASGSKAKVNKEGEQQEPQGNGGDFIEDAMSGSGTKAVV